MEYQQVLDYIYSQLPMYQRVGAAAYKHDLGKTLELDEYFGHPHRKFKTIHIAGTNGKGSVAHSLASILQEAGYKTGLYTSPHYLDFRERIKINGEKISEQYVINFVNSNKKFFERLRPSFFEMTVAMAFKYFAESNVDIAVIEVGMGGRLDSTNIITPMVSVITNIGYDHMQFLGETLPQIAREKAGIIKPRVPVVIGAMPAAVQSVFIEKATEQDAPIYQAASTYSVENAFLTSDGKLAFSVYSHGKLKYKNVKFGLTGDYQRMNIPIILQTIDVLNQHPVINISQQALYNGMEKVVENTGIMGRWQVISRFPLIVCDAGHNEDGIRQVVSQIKRQKYRKLFMVFGTVKDKKIDKILRLLPSQAEYIFVKSSVDRSMDAPVLAGKAMEYGLEGQAFENVEKGLDYVLEHAKNEDMIFIGGSTFVVADALSFFHEKGFKSF